MVDLYDNNKNHDYSIIQEIVARVERKASFARDNHLKLVGVTIEQ